MSLSLDAIAAFSTAAELGSFSAAARRLGKSQSTISEAIANLEIDLGVSLFERSGRQPVLTPAGQQLLSHARQLLDASDTLGRVAGLLGGGLEPRLTIVLSDTFQSQALEQMLRRFEQQFPALELETLVAEKEDVIDLVESGRAQLGFVSGLARYPADIGHYPMADASQSNLYVASGHPLATLPEVSREQLAAERELRLNTYYGPPSATLSARCWSAPSYLLLLEMTRLGFGWAELPCWLAVNFGGDELQALNVAGWPKSVRVDLVWSQARQPGRAAAWVLAQLMGTGG
ncbi:LysR family transcriptional regulator [Aquitalea sp. FJL05]|uniref:LysR family transcriptional regulator n=1 Tax=Aquitalea TaxID=407217 RepID=UPI000F59840B|nr:MULTISPECIES: LysR family transcriptional regulator [Aquitalea]RQO72980.1 LysR family transcriptional regulator [Aquitalea sp. FJL05]